MTETSADGSLQMADVQKLQDLVDREALGEVCRTFFDLFGLPVRVFNREGRLLANVHQQRTLCSYVNGIDAGHAACAATVSDVRCITAEEGREVLHPCFTGAVYKVVPIRYDGRGLGRFVVGPYLPSETLEVPQSLLALSPQISPDRAAQHLREMPRVNRATADRITSHLSRVLDLILFSGHKAYLTSHMHLASARANFRELAEKTAELQRAYDELKELDRLKSNFLATISHELRTPLTSIIGYSEMLGTGMGGDLNEEQQGFVETIRAKGDQLLELIASLLDMARFEQGKVDLSPQRVDPRALATDIMQTVRPAADKKGVRITCNIAAALPEIAGDPVRLRQVLLNLMDNALKFTPSGGHVELSVSPGELVSGDDGGAGAVLLMAAQPAVEFEVSDTGPGIAERELSRIFDAFYQVDGSVTREHGGTGLGLSIVRRLVEAHGGAIRVTSALGEGSTFVVTLPEQPSMG